MKKNLIIHIGPHKTGSTYLQSTLFNNQKQLKETGFEYSDVFKEGDIAHHSLASMLIKKEYDIAKIFLRDIQNTENNIILSSENFDMLDIKDIEFLASQIKSHKIKIVFFKRRLDDLLISSWQESIKHGGIDSWAKYSFKHLIKPMRSEVLNNDKIVNLYANVFGIDNIKIIDYDFVKESEKDICDVFFEAINLSSLRGIGSDKNINKSMTYSHIEIIRILNILYRKKNKRNPHHYLRKSFIDINKNDSDSIELILKIKETIEKNLEHISLNNNFIFNFLENNFYKKYDKVILNNNSREYLKNKMIYQLPNENWYIEEDIIKKIELIYYKIEEDITIQLDTRNH